MLQEVFANQLAPGPFLTGPITNNATSCTVSNASDFPAIGVGQFFRMVIQDTADGPVEIVLVTAVSGPIFTISRGAEGSTPVAHIMGAAVANALTAQAMINVSPSLKFQTGAGNFAWPLDTNGFPYKKVILQQGSPGSANVNLIPANFIPGQTYILIDGARIAEEFTIALVPETGEFINTPSNSSFPLSSAGQAVEFATDGTNFWVE